jgi:hypothetical protein
MVAYKSGTGFYLITPPPAAKELIQAGMKMLRHSLKILPA